MDKKQQTPAIEGGSPTRSDFLPFFRPSIDDDDIEAVTATLKSGWLTLGPQTQKFEDRLRDYLSVSHLVAVSSCSAAMLLALKALGVGPGDEVVTSALTFASTVHAIIHVGATPVLVDIEMETFGLSVDDVAQKITPKTKALLPVHFGGQACCIEPILELAKKHGVYVIEDAAHSFGATFNGTRIGNFGDATAFSFYATKNLTCGEGGALSVKDDRVAHDVRLLSYHGMSTGSWRRYTERGSWYYEVDQPGYKFNMNDPLSSLGISQLGKIDRLLERRRDIATQFTERLSGSPFFEIPRVASGNEHTWHLYVVLLNLGKLSIDRGDFTRALAAENIGCSVHFIPIYRHEFFSQFDARPKHFPNCEDYFSRCISLPIFPDMTDDDVLDVVRALNRIANYYAKS